MRISLQKNIAEVYGSVPFISIIDGNSGNRRYPCSSKILLKATFQKPNLLNSSPACTNISQFGNNMLKIDLRLSATIHGFSFHIGDSKTNNGLRYHSAIQKNDAQFYFLGYSSLLYGSSKCSSSMYKGLAGLLNKNVTTITIYVGNEFIRVTNNNGYIYDVCSSCLFALNGQPDSEGPANEEIYIGINRPISELYQSKAKGICSAEISWICS
ncbi:hypothetical protein ACJMK2_026782 [Sinanodonta woodiana]|uniref:Uncharacterized protein n=1 Tax=Sinanodonta woodiana TaxID=1069815 RepID=A0ABD3XPB5_SINWO